MTDSHQGTMKTLGEKALLFFWYSAIGLLCMAPGAVLYVIGSEWKEAKARDVCLKFSETRTQYEDCMK